MKQTINESNQFTNWLTWLLILYIAFCLPTQVHFANKALDLFNTAVVSPMLYVIFTTLAIIASGILFKEWGRLTPEDCIGNVCGFFVIVCGVAMLQTFREVNVTLPDFIRSRKQPEDPSANSDSNLQDKLKRSDPKTHLDEESSVSLLENEHSIAFDDD